MEALNICCRFQMGYVAPLRNDGDSKAIDIENGGQISHSLFRAM